MGVRMQRRKRVNWLLQRQKPATGDRPAKHIWRGAASTRIVPWDPSAAASAGAGQSALDASRKNSLKWQRFYYLGSKSETHSGRNS